MSISRGAVNMILEEADEEMLANIREKVRIRPAMDSGAVANVLHPKDLPADAEPKPNTTGRHFVGANNSKIEKYGSCVTQLESELGAIGCNWQLADVSRPLHSVSEVTGPAEHPTGKQDVLFKNRKCLRGAAWGRRQDSPGDEHQAGGAVRPGGQSLPG